MNTGVKREKSGRGQAEHMARVILVQEPRGAGCGVRAAGTDGAGRFECLSRSDTETIDRGGGIPYRGPDTRAGVRPAPHPVRRGKDPQTLVRRHMCRLVPDLCVFLRDPEWKLFLPMSLCTGGERTPQETRVRESACGSGFMERQQRTR